MIQWQEVVWTLAALIGLGYAVWNGREARRDMRAVLISGTNGARLLWAKFSRLLHISLITIESLFAIIGIRAMFLVPSPKASSGIGQFITVVALVTASLLLTAVSIMWQRVHVAIATMLRKEAHHD